MGRPSTRWTWCSEHHKRAFTDAEAAADALAGLPDGDVMAAYPCTEHPQTSHIGHMTHQAAALVRLTAGRQR